MKIDANRLFEECGLELTDPQSVGEFLFATSKAELEETGGATPIVAIILPNAIEIAMPVWNTPDDKEEVFTKIGQFGLQKGAIAFISINDCNVKKIPKDVKIDMKKNVPNIDSVPGEKAEALTMVISTPVGCSFRSAFYTRGKDSIHWDETTDSEEGVGRFDFFADRRRDCPGLVN